jgi:7-keto-8-aminopelargonate synthetase-like enzyme
MHHADFSKLLNVDRSPLDAAGFNPYYRSLGGLQHGQPWIGRSPFFDLASNDYLGLASDRRIHEAMDSAIREYGSSMCGTPIATGYASIFAQLESELARFTGLPAVVLFPSCYQANVSLISTIAKPADVIFIDHYAHASLGQGARAAGCKVKPFLHNDVQHLEKQLASCTGFQQKFIVTESVFSTEGSVAPLQAIVDLSRRYEAVPIIDDSHGLGVIGDSGRGILEYAGLGDFPGIYTASLGKALANAGGMVAGDFSFIEAVRYSCPGLIYSTALTPASVAGALAALEIITSEFSRLGDLLWKNHRLLLECLNMEGFPVSQGPAPIASIRAGSSTRTLALAKDFFARGILATPFIPPSVPQNGGVLRCILGAKLTGLSLEDLLESIHHVGALQAEKSTGTAVEPLLT